MNRNDPYNNNPFATDNGPVEFTSEFDANLALLRNKVETTECKDDPFNRGYKIGVYQTLSNVQLARRDPTGNWLNQIIALVRR